MSIAAEHIEDWRGKDVRDPSGENVGRLTEVWLDSGSATPLLGTVKLGRLTRHAKMVPIDGASVGPDYVRVAHAKAAIEASPDTDGSSPPGAAELDEIGKAYGLRFSDRVHLESATSADQRRGAAEEAQRRAEEAEALVQDKLAALEDARGRSEGASAEADQARREADEAQEAARKARLDADRLTDNLS